MTEGDTTVSSGSLRMNRLPASTARLISSSQVIASPFSVVKELVENSLDAFATCIDVKLEDGGLARIEVRDNGRGIASHDTGHMAQRHYTSKICSTDDLLTLTTYGFRGEALGSLCAVADVTITTKTADDDVSMTHDMNRKGEVTGTQPSHVGQGTTVVATSLFAEMPVRRLFYAIPARRREELKRLQRLLAAFSVIRPDVRFSLVVDRGAAWSRAVVPDYRRALAAVWGSKVVAEMVHRTDELSEIGLRVELFVPKSTSCPILMSRSNADQCFMFVNKRPVVLRDLEKRLRQSYVACVGCDVGRVPLAFVAVDLPSSRLDFNVDPNKTRVLLRDRVRLLSFMAAIFEDVYGAPRANVTQRDAGDTGGDGGSEGGAGKQGGDGGAGAGGGAGRGGDTEGDGRADKNPLPSDSSSSERNVRRENPSQQNGGSAPNAVSRDVSVAPDLRPESTYSAIGRSRRESVNRSSIGTFSDDATKTVFDGNHNDVASEVDVQKNGAVVGDDVDNLEVDFNLLDDDLDLDQRLVECLQAASDDVGGSTGATWSRGRALEQQATPVVLLQPPSSVDSPGLAASPHGVPSSSRSGHAKTNLFSVLQGQRTLDDLDNGKLTNSFFDKVGGRSASVNEVISHDNEVTGRSARGNEVTERRDEDKHEPSAWQLERCKEDPLARESRGGDPRRRSEVRKKRRLTEVGGHGAESARRAEVTVPFSMSSLKVIFSRSLSTTQAWWRRDSERPRLIGPLPSHGVWLCVHNGCVTVAHPGRIQEQLTYRRLMANQIVPSEPLEQPIELNAELVGGERAWAALLSALKGAAHLPHSQLSYDDDERLVKNGFLLRPSADDDGGGRRISVVAMATCVNFYGLADLREVITAIASSSAAATACSVERCRPAKIKHFFQGEAVRMSRNVPANRTGEEMRQLLDDMQQLHLLADGGTCFHGKPLLHALYDLAGVFAPSQPLDC